LKQVVAILLGLLLLSCNKEVKEPQAEQGEPEPLFETSMLQDALEEVFRDARVWNSIYPELRFGDTLLEFYKDRKLKPLWLDGENENLFSILEVFADARFEGLQPNYYSVDTLRSLSGMLNNYADADLYKRMAWMEVKISDHLLSFHRDRVVGRTEPDSIFKSAYKLPRRVYDQFDLMSVLDARHFKKSLSYNTHQEPEYTLYSNLLKEYYAKIDSGEKWFSIDTTGIKRIDPGDSVTIMPDVMHKLAIMGMVPTEQALKADSFVYNKKIAPFIEQAQERFGLFADGVLGVKTLELINTKIEDRLEQIAATMERLRWFEVKEDPPYILVNLPAFKLQLFHPDSIQEMRVCIGKARPNTYDAAYEKYLETGKWWDRPRDFETPQVSSRVHYLVVNPTWTVPKSIITREMFHKMKKDSFYLRDNGYGVFYKGIELNRDTINWSKFKADKIPFTIVQEAGDANALGKVKFIFPNPFHVYLHDTPQRSKFKWTERAVSHGCVRVEQPIQLGEFLMMNHKEFDSDDFRIMMGYKPEDEDRLKDYDPEDSTAEIQPIDSTEIIRLKDPVPVYFLYNTIWFDEDGVPQYRRDVYDKNRKVLEAMRQPGKVKFK